MRQHEHVREYLDYLALRNLKIIYSIKDIYEGTVGIMNRCWAGAGRKTLCAGW